MIRTKPWERPLLSKLLEKEEYRETYHQYLREIVENYVQSVRFAETVEKVTSVIDSYVQANATSFDGYDAYVEGGETLRSFVALRTQGVLGQLEGTIPSVKEKQKSAMRSSMLPLLI